jgi:Protein of unknown function (DUF2480)
MENEIVNRVANSNLITFDLEQYYVQGDRVIYDVKDHLFQGLILKEKDFRYHIRSFDWSQYSNKLVAITCSADAVIPTWAYMLLAVALKPFAKRFFFGSIDQLESQLFAEAMSEVDWEHFKDAKVVVKGCSHLAIPVSAYVNIVDHLLPFANSVMFGEPCSTVPLYKRPKA